MKEKFPKSPAVEKLKKPEGVEIPLFERLDEESQKFVLEVQELSEMSREEFLKKYPQVAEFIRAAKERRGIWAKRMEQPGAINELKSWFEEMFRKEELEPELLSDLPEERYFATMWQLVRLHLLELQDFLEYQEGGHYSRKTEYLAKEILSQATKVPNGVILIPDSIKNTFFDLQDKGLPMYPPEMIVAIHRIINGMHASSSRNVYMPSMALVKDLWRYAIIRINKGKGVTESDWAGPYNDFFNKLSGLKLKGEEPKRLMGEGRDNY